MIAGQSPRPGRKSAHDLLRLAVYAIETGLVQLAGVRMARAGIMSPCDGWGSRGW